MRKHKILENITRRYCDMSRYLKNKTIMGESEKITILTK